VPSCCKSCWNCFGSHDAKHCELIHMDSERQTTSPGRALPVPRTVTCNQQTPCDKRERRNATPPFRKAYQFGLT